MLTPDSLLFVQAAKKAALKGTNASTLKKVRTSATFHRCVTRSPSAARNSRVSWVSRTARADGRQFFSPLSPFAGSDPALSSSPLFYTLSVIVDAAAWLDSMVTTSREPTSNRCRTRSPARSLCSLRRMRHDCSTMRSLVTERRVPQRRHDGHGSAARRPLRSLASRRTSARRSRACRAWMRTAPSCTLSTPSPR